MVGDAFSTSGRDAGIYTQSAAGKLHGIRCIMHYRRPPAYCAKQSEDRPCPNVLRHYPRMQGHVPTSTLLHGSTLETKFPRKQGQQKEQGPENVHVLLCTVALPTESRIMPDGMAVSTMGKASLAGKRREKICKTRSSIMRGCLARSVAGSQVRGLPHSLSSKVRVLIVESKVLTGPLVHGTFT